MPSSDTKIFISYASEDRDSFVEPLAKALSATFRVWWDQYSLTMGDRLRQKIHEGLSECDYGVVILSPAFFSKDWPRDELDGLSELEDRNKKMILPIYKDIDHAEVKKHSLFLAGRLAINASRGVAEVVEEIQRAVEVGNRTSSFVGPIKAKEAFAALNKLVANHSATQRLLDSSEGLSLIKQYAHATVDMFFSLVESAAASMPTVRIKPTRLTRPNTGVSVDAPNQLVAVFQWEQACDNSLKDSTLRLDVFRRADPWRGTELKRITSRKYYPTFRSGEKDALWSFEENTFTAHEVAEQAAICLSGVLADDHARRAAEEERKRRGQ